MGARTVNKHRSRKTAVKGIRCDPKGTHAVSPIIQGLIANREEAGRISESDADNEFRNYVAELDKQVDLFQAWMTAIVEKYKVGIIEHNPPG
jgi:hypothetical protein